MTRRAMTPERAAALRAATTESVMDHLRVAGVNVPANILAQGLAVALAEMIQNVKPRNRPDVIAKARAALDMVETRR